MGEFQSGATRVHGFAPVYWLFVGGQCLAKVTEHFMSVAIAAFTYNLTGSAWAYALQILIGIVPSVFMSGVAGRAVDHLDRRRVLVLSSVVSGALVLLYPLWAVPLAIYALNFLRSIAMAFIVPARIVLMPDIAGQEQIVRANGIKAALVGGVDLTMPALAGDLIGRIGTNAGFVIAALSMFAASVCWATLPRTGARAGEAGQRERAARRPRAQSETRQGELGPILARPLLATTVILYVIFAAGDLGTNAVYYPFVSSVVHAGPRFFGLVLSLYYGASLLGGALLAKFDCSRIPFPALILTAVFAWGGLAVFRTEIPLLWLSFFTGLVNCFIYTRYETTLQQHAPADMMGRIASVARAAYSAAQVTGILVCGQLAERLGPVPAYRWTFVGALILTLAAALAVRGIGRPKPVAGAAH